MPAAANPGVPQPPNGQGTNEQRLAAWEQWAGNVHRFLAPEAGNYIGNQVTAQQSANQKAAQAIELLTQQISDPPTQAELTAIQAKVNELLGLLSGVPAADEEQS